MAEVTIITLPPEAVETATRWASIVESNLPDRPNPHGPSAPDRYLNGYLGEIAFAIWCETEGLAYFHHVCLLGRSDAPEFELLTNDREWFSLDVKTASGAYHRYMMNPFSATLDADLYLGARLLTRDLRSVELCGWCTHGEYEAVAPTNPTGQCETRAMLLAGLRPMSELRAAVRRRRHVEGDQAKWELF